MLPGLARILPRLREARRHVRRASCACSYAGLPGASPFAAAIDVAAVAVDAAELHLLRLVHRLDAGVAGEAAGALGIGLGLRLPQQRGWRVVGCSSARRPASVSQAPASQREHRARARSGDRASSTRPMRVAVASAHQNARTISVPTWYSVLAREDVLEAADRLQDGTEALDDDVVVEQRSILEPEAEIDADVRCGCWAA